MIHAYLTNMPKNIVMASSVEDDSRIDELMEFLLTNNLLDHYAISNGMDMAQWEANKQMSRDIQSAFFCDVSNGIFEANTQEQHDALMRHLQRLQKYGMLNKQSMARAENAVVLKELRPESVEEPISNKPLEASASTGTLVPSPSSTSSPALSRQQLREEFIREIKSRYQSGIPLRLSDALKQYCALRNRAESRDERSRIKILSESLGDLFLHEYSLRHFTNYKQIKLKDRNVRTLDERIGLARRIFQTLIEQRVYHGENPLKSWKPSTSSVTRKQKAAASIATMDRVASVFGSPEFAEFGSDHPAYYLIIMTAIATGMRITSICRLHSTDLLMTLDGIPVIDVHHRDKTLAGKRQVPVPQDLFDSLKAFLEVHGSFGIEDRGEKGCSDAIRDLNQKFFEQNSKFSNSLLNPHGLRAALNNYLVKNGIQLDIRCAFLGHSLSHVNHQSYSSGISTPVLVDGLCGIQEKILAGVNFNPDISATLGYLIAGDLDRFSLANDCILQ